MCESELDSIIGKYIHTGHWLVCIDYALQPHISRHDSHSRQVQSLTVPICGLPPAPRPLVSFSPICNLLFALIGELASACTLSMAICFYPRHAEEAVVAARVDWPYL